ncbi:MAG: TonB-dependent receptor plug domain-containing protein, partial [Cyclobacteriaceae bacterium]
QKPEEMEEVQISEKRDKDWEKKLKSFEKFFLGENNNSENCKIQNPWVINFSQNSSKSTMEASAAEPIEIFNYGLGYKIYFYMTNFSANPEKYQIVGQFRFEEAEPLEVKQANNWKKNRIDTYHGSERHLFKALIDGRAEVEGFRLYVEKPGNPLTIRSNVFSNELNKSVIEFDTKDIVKKGKNPGQYTITLPPRLEVHYTNEYATKKYYKDVPFQVSWIEVDKGQLTLTKDGVVLNSIDLVTSGAISASRVADLLPVNYSPNVEVGNATVRIFPKLSGWSKYKRMQEFAYLQTDKPYYYPGERIWMKASMLYRDNELLDSLSKVLYVELINEKKICVAREYLNIDSAFATGYLDLPDSTSKGNYFLRAYTNWMRNYGSETFFVKPLPILNITDKVLDENVEYDTATLVVHFNTNKKSYSTRDSISLNLNIADQKGTPIQTNLSVSVTDAVLVKSISDQSTILDFSMKDNVRPVNDEFEPNYPVETGIPFSGLFVDDKEKPQRTDASVVQKEFNTVIPITTNRQGEFTVTGLNFSGKLEFGFQALTKKGKQYGKFSLLAREFPLINFEAKYLPLRTEDMNAIQVPITTYTPDADTRLLGDVTIEGTRIENYNPNTASLYGKADYTVKGEDLQQVFTGSNLIQALQGKIPGIQVSYGWDENHQDAYRVRLRGGSSTMGVGYASNEPLLIVDGIPFGGDPNISIANYISAIPTQHVERVEVITSAVSLLGTRGANGAILIYTKDSGIYKEELVDDRYPDMQTLSIQGYQKAEPFPAPSYGKTKITPTNDVRTTIHWEPNITTDRDGNAQVSFYSADLEGVYRVVVEGLAIDGRPVRGEYMISIENP